MDLLIRSSFFSVLKSIAGYFAYATNNHKELEGLLSCVDWSFKARDFEDLLKLEVFQLLH